MAKSPRNAPSKLEKREQVHKGKDLVQGLEAAQDRPRAAPPAAFRSVLRARDAHMERVRGGQGREMSGTRRGTVRCGARTLSRGTLRLTQKRALSAHVGARVADAGAGVGTALWEGPGPQQSLAEPT